MLQEICKRLHGSYAVITYNGNNPYQLAAFRDGRPLELAVIKPLKLAILASEKDFLRNAIFRYNQMSHLYQTGASKFISLGKGDVDIEGLNDDTLFLFDLRDDITKDTKISDLFISEKVPRTNKMWGISGGTVSTGVGVGSTVKTVTGFEHINRNKNSAIIEDDDDDTDWNSVVKGGKADDNKKDVKDTKETPLKSICENRIGMAWNRAAGKYDSVGAPTNSDDAADFTVIDLEETAVTDILDGEKKTQIVHSDTEVSSQTSAGVEAPVLEKKACDLTETYKAPDDLIEDPAKITEVKILKEPAVKRPSVKDTYTSMTEVTVATHPDVVEKSIVVSKEEMQFSNDGDLCNAIEISDTSIMKSMPLYSLGNRIKNYFFRKGFQIGYVTHENEVAAGNAVRNMLVRSRNKVISSQQNIRVLKAMVKLLCSVIDSSPDHLKEHNNTEMETAVTKIRSTNTEFTAEQLEKIFKRGDTSIHPTIQHIMDAVGKQ